MFFVRRNKMVDVMFYVEKKIITRIIRYFIYKIGKNRI